jgi:hypothetical protein
MKGKNKFFLIVFLFFGILLSLFFFAKERKAIHHKLIVKKSINNDILRNTPPSLQQKPYLYDNSKKAKDISQELVEQAENNDGDAAYRLVELGSICGLVNSTTSPSDIDGMLISIGDAMLKDKSGRLYFNQQLTFPGIPTASFDIFSDAILDGINYCQGYELDQYAQVFHFLKIAAKNGKNKAKVYLWNMDIPEYMIAKAKNFQDSTNLDYLSFSQENKIWKETRINYLYEAANAGEEMAWVLLGDLLSSDELVLPNLYESYKYYFAAYSHYKFPFLFQKLSTLEKHLTKNEIKTGKINGSNLFNKFN